MANNDWWYQTVLKKFHNDNTEKGYLMMILNV